MIKQVKVSAETKEALKEFIKNCKNVVRFEDVENEEEEEQQ